jgi:hypothetical protein
MTLTLGDDDDDSVGGGDEAAGKFGFHFDGPKREWLKIKPELKMQSSVVRTL